MNDVINTQPGDALTPEQVSALMAAANLGDASIAGDEALPADAEIFVQTDEVIN